MRRALFLSTSFHSLPDLTTHHWGSLNTWSRDRSYCVMYNVSKTKRSFLRNSAPFRSPFRKKHDLGPILTLGPLFIVKPGMLLAKWQHWGTFFSVDPSRASAASEWSVSDHALLAHFKGLCALLPSDGCRRETKKQLPTHPTQAQIREEKLITRKGNKRRGGSKSERLMHLRGGGEGGSPHRTCLQSLPWRNAVGSCEKSSGRIQASFFFFFLTPPVEDGSSCSAPSRSSGSAASDREEAPRSDFNCAQQRQRRQRSEEREKKVVWLLFLRMMSHPDSVRLCVCACVRVRARVCVWKTYKLKE